MKNEEIRVSLDELIKEFWTMTRIGDFIDVPVLAIRFYDEEIGGSLNLTVEKLELAKKWIKRIEEGKKVKFSRTKEGKLVFLTKEEGEEYVRGFLKRKPPQLSVSLKRRETKEGKLEIDVVCFGKPWFERLSVEEMKEWKATWGHIVLSPKQAIELAKALQEKAKEALKYEGRLR